MRNLPVNWSEGMFLRPHHFQAADRYWTEVHETSTQCDRPYAYGLRAVSFSEQAIRNHQFQLDSCLARMRDGTLVSLEIGQEPDRLDLRDAVSGQRLAGVDLKEAFQRQTVVQVFLAVPRLQLGRPNVANAAAGTAPRYSATTLEVPEEGRGASPQRIDFRVPNVRLLLGTSTQSLEGYEVLPIAQIKRASDERAAPVLDDEYIPPVLALDAWPYLERNIVQAIYDMIGQKIDVLSEQAVNRGISFASLETGDLDRVMMLTILNEAYGTLSCLAFASGVHPFQAYCELCRVVGQLSILGPSRRAPDFPRYDHDNLAYIFKWVYQQFELLVNSLRDYEFEQRFFTGTARGMQVTLEPKWFNSTWSWFVGVKYANITADECREFLQPGKLDWKMGASAEVDAMFEQFKPGLALRPMTQAPRALPTGGGWIYYEVERGNAAWKSVVHSQTLALRFKRELIRNADSLLGQRNLVLATPGRDSTLQIALYAVPNS